MSDFASPRFNPIPTRPGSAFLPATPEANQRDHSGQPLWITPTGILFCFPVTLFDPETSPALRCVSQTSLGLCSKLSMQPEEVKVFMPSEPALIQPAAEPCYGVR